MISLQVKMGDAIIGLTEDKATNEAQLKKVQMLEHELEHVEGHPLVEGASRVELEAEVAEKEQLAFDLIEAQTKAVTLSE